MAPEDLSGRDNSPDADLRKELISEAATFLTRRSPRMHPRLTARIAALGAGGPLHPITCPPSPEPPAGDDHMTDDQPHSGEDYSDLEEEKDEHGRESMDDDDWL
eukprot:jgi/Tetstr1/462447/TSEL_007445.t1